MRRLITFLAVWLIALVFIKADCCGKKPTIPIKPVGKSQSYVGLNELYRTMSTDPNNKTIKYVFDFGGTFDTTDFAPSGETTGCAVTWRNNGTYNVKALAITDDGRQSAGWSDPLVVTVGANARPNAPDPVTPDPASSTPKVKIQFSTKATDPDGDSVQIMFFYDYDSSKTSNSGWLPKDKGVPSGTIVIDSSFSYTKARDVPYVLKAVAREWKNGTTGQVSDTSAPSYITISKVGLGWRYPRAGDDINMSTFRFSPALMVLADNKLKIFGVAEGESVYAFTDDGGNRPSVSRSIYDREWEPSANDAGVLSSDKQRIYIPTDDFKLRCLSTGTLSQLGVYPNQPGDTIVKQEFMSPAVYGNYLYVGRGDSIVRLLDQNGALQYVNCYISNAEILYPPVINAAGDRIFFGNDTGLFICIDAECREIWKCGNSNVTSVAAIDDDARGGTVYVGRDDGRLYGYSQTDTNPVFTSVAMTDPVVGCPVIDAAGKVYVVREDGTVEAYTGVGQNVSPLWRSTPLANISGAAAPLLAPDTTIIIHTEDDWLVALRCSDGSEKWRFQLPSEKKRARRFGASDLYCAPTIGPGFKRIYVGSNNEGIFCAINVDYDSYVSGLPAAPWPKFQHDLRNSGFKGGTWVY